MMLVFLVSLVHLVLSAIVLVEGFGFGVYKDPSNNKMMYHQPLDCIRQSLYDDLFHRFNNERHLSYTPRTDNSCCYEWSTRNKCCRYYYYTGGTATERCKCSIDIGCGGCKLGWTYNEEKRTCVKLFTTTTDYFSASTQCRLFDSRGTLVKVTSYSFQEFLENKILNGQTGKVWIGVDRKIPDFRWVHSDVLVENGNFFRWVTGGTTTGDCVHMSAGNDWRWSGGSCKRKSAFLCQRPSGGANCGIGWVKYPPTKTCVQMGLETLGYDGAISQCRDLDGYLVENENSDYNNWLIVTFLQSETEDVWIGMRKLATPEFTLVGESNTITHYHWVSSRPTRTLNSDCVVMDSTWRWRWLDNDCISSYNYICEQPV